MWNRLHSPILIGSSPAADGHYAGWTNCKAEPSSVRHLERTTRASQRCDASTLVHLARDTVVRSSRNLICSASRSRDTCHFTSAITVNAMLSARSHLLRRMRAPSIRKVLAWSALIVSTLRFISNSNARCAMPIVSRVALI